MTGRSTVSHELLRQVLALLDKALDKDNVFGKLHNDAMDSIHEIRAALAEPALVQKSIGYVRMLNGEPTPDDNGYVFSYGKNPYRDTYGDEEWLPVFTAPQAQQPAPPAKVPLLTVDEQNEMMDNVIYKRWSLLDLVKNVEQAVRQKAGLV